MNKIALSYLKIEDLNNSIKFYKESIKINKLNLDAYNNLGKIYLDHLGDINRAVYNFSCAIQINPKIEYLHRNLGKAYNVAGDFDKAKFHLILPYY